MQRKPFVIIASAIVIIGLVVAGLFFLLGNSAELTVTDDPFSGTGSPILEGEALLEASSGAGEEVAPRLIRVTNRPVAEGIIAFTRTSTTTAERDTASGTPEVIETSVTDTEVRFIDRASGNIYRYLAHGRSLTRISNKTLPGIQQASWLSDGSVAYVRFLQGDQVAAYVLPDSGEGGFFLEQGLSVVKATNGGSLFTLLSGTTGSVGSVARSDGTNARTLFTSLVSSLIVHPTDGNFFGHTKASALLDGYGFRISATNGSFTRVLGPLRGLATLPSPDGTRLLYSYLDRGTVRLAVLDIETRTATALPVGTLVEKCAWASNGRSAYCGVPVSLPQGLPDLWYQGAATFTDRLWRIDMEARLATLVIDPAAVADVSIDAVALHTDPAEDILLFTDKHSGTLWAYDL